VSRRLAASLGLTDPLTSGDTRRFERPRTPQTRRRTQEPRLVSPCLGSPKAASAASAGDRSLGSPKAASLARRQPASPEGSLGRRPQPRQPRQATAASAGDRSLGRRPQPEGRRPQPEGEGGWSGSGLWPRGGTMLGPSALVMRSRRLPEPVLEVAALQGRQRCPPAPAQGSTFPATPTAATPRRTLGSSLINTGARELPVTVTLVCPAGAR